mmetsp:Transcript_12102/g.18460  ORF Transcript_12102/g.18460 Transcript_12102/m.18460 type:complete len:224 (+) Transcript_12102:175-846(+)
MRYRVTTTTPSTLSMVMKQLTAFWADLCVWFGGQIFPKKGSFCVMVVICFVLIFASAQASFLWKHNTTAFLLGHFRAFDLQEEIEPFAWSFVGIAFLSFALAIRIDQKKNQPDKEKPQRVKPSVVGNWKNHQHPPPTTTLALSLRNGSTVFMKIQPGAIGMLSSHESQTRDDHNNNTTTTQHLTSHIITADKITSKSVGSRRIPHQQEASPRPTGLADIREVD